MDTMVATVGLPTLMIVDDDAFGVAVLDDLIGEVVTAEHACFTDPIEAVEWLATHVPDLVITDFDMPGIDGLGIIERVRSNPRTADVPLLMLTGIEDPQLRVTALEAGASDFIQKPFDPAEVRTRVRNMLALREGQKALKERAADLAEQVEEAVRVIKERERETILKLARAAEFRDTDTHAHLQRISDYARVICLELKLEPSFTEALTLAAPMHDIGKIGIPDEIMLKPGRLTPEEYSVMKTHTTIGHHILDGSSSALLELAAEIALAHHERWDGEGYPHGLSGEATPLSGRIVAVADVFDALTTARPYKEAWDIEGALTYIQEQAGAQFDPMCAQAFLRRRAFVSEVCRKLAD